MEATILTAIVGVAFSMQATSVATQTVEAEAEQTANETAQIADDERGIIVRAQRKRREAVIQEFADKITRRPQAEKPLERWRGQLCPVVYGIKPQYGAIIKRRFIANLDKADLRANDDAEKCKPNILIGVVEDVDAEVRKLQQDYKSVFGSLLGFQIERAIEETGPVRSWNTTEVLSDRGQDLDDTQGNGFGGAPVNRNTTATRLNYQISVATRGAVVLIDSAALEGKSLKQLADYATMRVLVPTYGVSDAAAGPTDTILSLFSDEYAPEELTLFDRNYLEAYYSGAATLRPRQIYGRIGSKVVDAEEGEEPVAEGL